MNVTDFYRASRTGSPVLSQDQKKPDMGFIADQDKDCPAVTG